jgi:hypothetical protein
LDSGAIFAAWPPLYAVAFSGFYLAMFLVLCALILRPVAFKFRSKGAHATAIDLGLGRAGPVRCRMPPAHAFRGRWPCESRRQQDRRGGSREAFARSICAVFDRYLDASAERRGRGI